MRGFIFYHGTSPIDGAPIVGIATLKSRNAGTGNMVQTFILREDVHPLEAVATRGDVSICGDCTHRGLGGAKRTCYVDVAKSVAQVWLAYRRGSYADLSDDLPRAAALLRRRRVRLGAYGDPAMIDHLVWYALLADCAGWTGYTHQWRFQWAAAIRELCMASVESVRDADIARSLGWRTFRVNGDGVASSREMICPKSDEGGARLQCVDCGACDGALKPTAASVTIRVHGAMSRHFAV